jgi:hypothetical protein
VPARAIIEVGTLDVPPRSGWDSKDINSNDPVEVALAESLQNSVADFTSGAFVGPWNTFVI